VKPLTVSRYTSLIKEAVENDPELISVWITGEISNLTYHSSGHIYFSLKDPGAVISAVFFKNSNRQLKFRLEEGMSVLVFGGITLFEKRGSYQFNVQSLKLEGTGELQKQIEQLKKKLTEEGIFDESRRRPLPFLPRRIGVVTSPTGAAVRDIIKVALRRFPNIEIIIAPAKVQGDDAARSIVKALEEINRPEHNIDIIIAGRGGGSFEDLMPFNDEGVVRAFRNSRVPIISAVGHQTDHPLSDDAADIYAPTPSAAAEIAVPSKRDLMSELDYVSTRVESSLTSAMRERRSSLESVSLKKIFRDPYELISIRELYLGDLESKMAAGLTGAVSSKLKILNSLPDLNNSIKNILKESRHRFGLTVGKIDQLSPLGVLKRGYTAALGMSGTLLRSVSSLSEGETIKLIFTDGKAQCSVTTIEEGEPFGKKS
jgi:exodeoxyribonuclease VII large subunit